MDGTRVLLESFARLAPRELLPVIVPLAQLGSYDELLPDVRKQVPADGAFFLLGESFSGPLALRLASEYSDRVSGLILCNTFVTPPRSPTLRLLPWSLITALPLPRWFIRRFLVGRSAPSSIVSAVQAAVAMTPSPVLAARMRAIFSLSPIALLRTTTVPILPLHATQASLAPPSVAEMIRSNAPHASRADIRPPHLLLQTAPEEAWEAIRQFVRRVKSEG